MAIKAQLFITCLAEQFFPDVLKGMVGLLERLGVQVALPESLMAQTLDLTKLRHRLFGEEIRRLIVTLSDLT